MAFKNWHRWLKAGGAVIVIEGLYDRPAWVGRWEEEVDLLPLSACRTTATVPYLLEQAGFNIDAVYYMNATNALPATRTQRYIVFASKQVEPRSPIFFLFLKYGEQVCTLLRSIDWNDRVGDIIQCSRIFKLGNKPG
jgi:hypothetical protein